MPEQACKNHDISPKEKASPDNNEFGIKYRQQNLDRQREGPTNALAGRYI